MIFQHTWQKVMSGEKTLTSRIALPEPDGTKCVGCEMISYPMGIKAVVRGAPDDSCWHIRYQVGRTYAIQPTRTAKAIGRIRVTGIKRYDVRDISEQEAQAEGFTRAVDFLILWCQMHDKQVILPVIPDYNTGLIAWADMGDCLAVRPDNCYQAWQLSFEVMK